MSWMYVIYGVGVIVGGGVVFLIIKELAQIFKEKDDYDDKVDLPD